MSTEGDLRDLYQEVILDHGRHPRNLRHPSDANRHAYGHNPLCGDHYTVFLKIKDNRIEDVGFQGAGCAISKASASMMTTAIKGATVEDVEELFNKFHAVTCKTEKNDQFQLMYGMS